MHFSLKENGADSLKGTSKNIDKLDELQDGKDHVLKDAVIFLNHGIEILFKVMLSERSPALMFDNLKEYQKAKETLKKTDKNDVFEINPNLKTITLNEALARIEYLCDIDIESEMKAAIYELNKIRNQLMHFSLTLEEGEVENLINKLKFCYSTVCDFFEEHIEGIDELIDKARYEYTYEEYIQDKAEWQAELMMEEQRLGLYD